MQDLTTSGLGDPTLVEPGRLTVEMLTDARGVLVRLEGELDLETAAELDRQLAALNGSPITRLLIDLGGVTFMDSTGLASIVGAYRSAETNGYPLVLRRGANQVQRLFALTGVDEFLIYEGD